MLICPNASSTPSLARMRLAIANSWRISASGSGMGSSLYFWDIVGGIIRECGGSSNHRLGGLAMGPSFICRRVAMLSAFTRPAVVGLALAALLGPAATALADEP